MASIVAKNANFADLLFIEQYTVYCIGMLTYYLSVC
jgi:hypothetical protein